MTSFFNPNNGGSHGLDFLTQPGEFPGTVWFVPKKELVAIVGYKIFDELEPISSFGVWESDAYVMLNSRVLRPTPVSFIYTITRSETMNDDFISVNRLFGVAEDPFWVHWLRSSTIDEKIQHCLDWGALQWAYQEWATLKNFPGKKCMDRIMLALVGKEQGSRIWWYQVERQLEELLLAQGRTFRCYCEESLDLPFDYLKKHPFEAIQVIRRYHIHASALSRPDAFRQPSSQQYGAGEFTACVLASMSEELLAKIHCTGLNPGRFFRSREEVPNGTGWSAVSRASCQRAEVRWSMISERSAGLSDRRVQVLNDLS